MTLRSAFFIAYASFLGSSAYADEPPTEALRPAVEFKDLAPPVLPEGHAAPVMPGLSDAPSENYGFFTDVTYLLMRPRRGAFDFAISDPNHDLVPQGKLESLNYDLRSGVRIGLGYQFNDSLWDTKFEYTYFRSRAESSIAAPSGGTLYATLTRAGLNDEADTALATGGLDYNVYDAVLGRRIVLDDRASIRLFGGIRFASIRQTFSAYYNGGDANYGHVEADNGYDGFGAVLGGEMNWTMRYGFSLYARGDAALMTGKLTNPFLETNNGGQTLYAQLDDTTRAVIPVAGIAIGAGWQHDNFSIRAGYEFTNWFGLIQTPRFTGELSEGKFTIRSGDLSLEGFFVKVAYSF